MNRPTEPYLATHLHQLGGRLGLPISGNFELTARCNFRCPMCYVHLNADDISARGQELTAAQWIELARQAKDKGMMFVLLTGGEPFIRKDFFEIYDAIKRMGLMVSINTNGSLLDGEIRQHLINNPPFRINVSLYGGCRETYRSMCGQDAFDRVIDNIKAIQAAGIDIRINLSITPYNKQDIEKIYALSQELNLHIKGTSYMYPPIRVNGSQYGCGSRLSPEEAAGCSIEWDRIRMTPEAFRQRGESLAALMADDPQDCTADTDEGVRCRAGHTSFWLTWDGRMLPCGMMPMPVAFPLQTGFGAAWEQIKAETKKIGRPAKCGSCAKKDLCFACAAVCITETGSFSGVPEYVCRMIDETFRLAKSTI